MAKYVSRLITGGAVVFDGVNCDGKSLASAVHTTANGRDIITETYADGNIYRFDCIKNGDSLTDIREYWNGVQITGGGANVGS